MKKVVYKNGIVTYEEVADAQITEENIRNAKLAEIEQCEALLSASDYKVTKNAECLALGLELPYNAEELHKERQALRDRINALEKEL